MQSYATCRCGWLYKESGCTWKVSLLEEISEHSCQKRPRNLTTLTKRSRRFVMSDTLTRLGRNVHARYWQKKDGFFSSQGVQWSGNGKEKRKFLRAGKSQGILFWVRKTWHFTLFVTLEYSFLWTCDFKWFSNTFEMLQDLRIKVINKNSQGHRKSVLLGVCFLIQCIFHNKTLSFRWPYFLLLLLMVCDVSQSFISLVQFLKGAQSPVFKVHNKVQNYLYFEGNLKRVVYQDRKTPKR